MKNEIKVTLIKYVNDHPIAIEHPDRCIEIRKIENAVIVSVNKRAKEDDGVGPQLHIEVGNRITLHQAKQISRNYACSIIPVFDIKQEIVVD